MYYVVIDQARMSQVTDWPGRYVSPGAFPRNNDNYPNWLEYVGMFGQPAYFRVAQTQSNLMYEGDQPGSPILPINQPYTVDIPYPVGWLGAAFFSWASTPTQPSGGYKWLFTIDQILCNLHPDRFTLLGRTPFYGFPIDGETYTMIPWWQNYWTLVSLVAPAAPGDETERQRLIASINSLTAQINDIIDAIEFYESQLGIS